MDAVLPKTSYQQRVLVVEDEPKLSRVVRNYLEREGYLAHLAETCTQALQSVKTLKPDLVILDIMLPDGSGLEVLKKIRSSNDTAVILLTARSEEVDKIVGLELGADDYVSKPFSVRELMARVKTIMRRVQKSAPPQRLRLAKLELDRESKLVFVLGERIDLTTTEYLLLECLLSAPNKVFSRSELFERAMPESDALERVLNSHFRNLRKKLANAGVSIESVRGFGYKLVEVS